MLAELTDTVSLPDELLTYLLQYLGYEIARQVDRPVCKRWRRLAKAPEREHVHLSSCRIPRKLKPPERSFEVPREHLRCLTTFIDWNAPKVGALQKGELRRWHSNVHRKLKEIGQILPRSGKFCVFRFVERQEHFSYTASERNASDLLTRPQL